MATSHPFSIAESRPDHPAIVMATTGQALTYGQLTARARRVEHLLHAIGVRRGDCIAIFAENTIDFLPIVWAAQSSGLYYTAINSHLTADEVAYVVNDCGAKVLFSTEALAPVVGNLTAAAAPVLRARVMSGVAADGWLSLDTELASQPEDPLDGECEGDFFLYSSGTTGRPKGVRRPIRFLPLGDGFDNVTGMRRMLEVFGIGPDTVYLATAPLYHTAPMTSCMSMHRMGATAVVMEKFDPEQALATIERYRVTNTQMVPTMFVRMLKLPAPVRSAYDLSSLQRVIHTAAPCSIDVKHQMIEWLGPIIDETYASTEGVGSTFITAAEWLERPGSVGRAVVGVPHILDETGNELPAGAIGTVWFEGTSSFAYHQDDAETAKTRNERGWSTVGDVGRLDEEGYLYLSDRAAFMIISGGVNIYPQEIENVLVSHPTVLDAAVFGVPNADFGEEVKAVVQPVDIAAASTELADELIRYCRDRIAAYKCPRSIDFTEQLPRSDSGKLYKRILRDRYWSVPS